MVAACPRHATPHVRFILLGIGWPGITFARCWAAGNPLIVTLHLWPIESPMVRHLLTRRLSPATTCLRCRTGVDDFDAGTNPEI